jgi:hypothetical protein
LEIRVPEELVVENENPLLVEGFIPPKLKLDEPVEPEPPVCVEALDPAKRTLDRVKVPSPCRPKTILFGSSALYPRKTSPKAPH